MYLTPIHNTSSSLLCPVCHLQFETIPFCCNHHPNRTYVVSHSYSYSHFIKFVFFLLLLFIHPFVFFSSSIPSIKYHSFYSFKKQSLALFDWTYTFTWLFINDDDDDDIMFFFNVLRFQAASSAESWKMTFCGSWWGMIKTIRNNRKTGKIHLKLIPSLKVKH